MTETVYYSVTPDRLGQLGDDLSAVLARGKRVIMEYPGGVPWTDRQLSEYVRTVAPIAGRVTKMGRLGDLFPMAEGCPAEDPRFMGAADTDGEICVCRSLTMERRAYSELRDAMSARKLRGVCPGQGEYPLPEALERIYLINGQMIASAERLA